MLKQRRYPSALSIYEQQLGSEDPRTAKCLDNLGGIYYYQGRYAEAEALSQRALSIYEQQLGSKHPETIRCSAHLATIRLHMQRKDIAAAPLVKHAFADQGKSINAKFNKNVKRRKRSKHRGHR